MERIDSRMTPRAPSLMNRFAILVLVLIPLAGTMLALKLLWQRAASWGDVALMLGLYVPVSMGITIGFHRYLTHRGFRTNVVFKTILLVLGSMAIEGSAIDFAALHR